MKGDVVGVGGNCLCCDDIGGSVIDRETGEMTRR